VLAGGLVTAALDGREREVRLTSAAVLAGLAVTGLARTLSADPGAAPPSTRPDGAFWRFLGLTALNPLTAAYFTVLAAGLGERVRSAAAATAFVVGVFVASLAWQAVLAVTGAALGTRLPAGARVWTSALGYGVVLALAGALAVSA
jgi:arginine exporter protein ArgO